MYKYNYIKDKKVGVFSCYFNNIHPDLLIYQKKVFEHFNMLINQELENDYLINGMLERANHGKYLDRIIKTVDADIFIFFDIDAIPLKNGLFEYIVNELSDNNSIIGVEQSFYFQDKYAGPACFGISKNTYEKLGSPSFCPVENLCDTAGLLTLKAKEYGVNVKYFTIYDSFNKLWKCENKWYGLGTNYCNLIYHQFTAHAHYLMFIEKCKTILNK
jgi:hypothetical protein